MIIEKNNILNKIKKTNYIQPLFIAVYENNISTVDYILSKGKIPDSQIMYYAVFHNYVDIVKLFITYGGKLNNKDESHVIAGFKYAIINNNIDILLNLVVRKSNININLGEGYTPLIYACYKKRTAIVRTLLYMGADPNHVADNQATALNAASMNKDQQIINMLFNYGCEVNKHNNKENIEVYKYAIIKGDIPLLMKLLDIIDVNMTDEKNHTPLMLACKVSTGTIVKLLLDSGADVNMKSYCEETALMKAVRAEKYLIVQLLINNGANINLQNTYGYNALLIACKFGYNKIAKILIKAGAEINLSDCNGMKPEDVAKQENNKYILKLIGTKK